MATNLVNRGEDAILSTAAGEVVTLTSDGDGWYLKVLINKRVHSDRRVGCMSRMPAEMGSMLERGERGKENHASVNNNHQDTQRF